MTARRRTGAFGYRDILLAFRRIGLEGGSRVMAIGPTQIPESIRGGAAALTAALAASCKTVIVPAFTYQTMVYPAEGPEDNAVDYPEASAASVEADFYRPSIRVSPLLGPLPENLRRMEAATRSDHPILSFAGLGAEDILKMQTMEDPFAPIDALAKAGGDVVVLGSDPPANAALHLAERRAGRRQFIRWALTPDGVVECPGFPGCSRGFGAIDAKLAGVMRSTKIGSFPVTRIPLRDLLNTAAAWIREDPQALLCRDPKCPFCMSVRKAAKLRSSEGA
ncbi:MAG: AAC(3) family N-acetyltransferase [Anaerolineales bacterium]|nr:AAC(3) family N-acetyltransferase [Anaerolineales bacterium]